MCSVLPSAVYFFHVSTSSLLKAESLFLSRRYALLSQLSFRISYFSNFISLELLSTSIFLILFLSYYFSLQSIFKPVLRNSLSNILSNSAKDCSLKPNKDVLLYKEKDASPNFVSSVTSSGADIAYPDQFQLRFNEVDLTRGSGSDLFIITLVAIQDNSLSIPNPYEFYCTSIDGVPGTSGTCRNMISMIATHCPRKRLAAKVMTVLQSVQLRRTKGSVRPGRRAHGDRRVSWTDRVDATSASLT